ncbi:hypothetical protein GOQ27_09740 [Clostridium sp. D2Q-11]|uniref:Flavodoxin n=1 Tax=Anaeromonas frigoriresistens TaxID=2683708 RepID=A0A942Z6R2_9FIRM|nr:hypothetical protein [Anaeromonas frigoriresistens]MBS4538746.1 hypothetical protein [Anaeromonas frigoriresistens]
MGYNIVYFSRTGVSKRVAEKVANGLDTKAIEVTDNKSWQGILGFIKGGFYATIGKEVSIKINGEIDRSEEYIVLSPLWAGGPAPAIRTFLKGVPSNQVKLVITCDGSNVEKAINKYENKHGKFKENYGIVKHEKNEERVIEEIINSSK